MDSHVASPGTAGPVIAIFLICAVVCAVLFLGVEVNYDLTDYLPEDAESTVALDLMMEEFGSGVPNTRVMAVDLTLAEALELKEEIAQAPGVTDVMWLDDVEDITTPVELMDEATVSQYWKDGKALYSVTIESGREVEATDAIYEIIGDSGAISGDAASTASMQKLAVSEVIGAAAVLVPLIIILLLLTTTSWIAPLLFLITIGVAVLINMGTNVVFGEISFVTQSVSPIMQLAVSLDYAIFLLNSFERHRREVPDPEEAMRMAIKESFSSIAASAATTVFGFLALIFMRFGIGSDPGPQPGQGRRAQLHKRHGVPARALALLHEAHGQDAPQAHHPRAREGWPHLRQGPHPGAHTRAAGRRALLPRPEPRGLPLRHGTPTPRPLRRGHRAHKRHLRREPGHSPARPPR